MVQKAPNAFRTISEVADWLKLPTHVLRFWESKIPEITPIKRAGGRRYYRPNDMLFLGGIKYLLHNEGLTIRALNKKILVEGVDGISTYSSPLDLGELETDKKSAKDTSKSISSLKPYSDKVNKGLEGSVEDSQAEHSFNSKSILKRKLRTVKQLKTNDQITLIKLIKKLSQKRNDIVKHLFVEPKNKY